MPTTAICFDVDGTLVTFDGDYGDLLEETFGAHLTDAELATEGLLETYDETFYEAFTALDPDPYRQGFVAACEHAGSDADPDALVATHMETEFAWTSVADATRESLDAFAAADDTVLGVITDGLPEWQIGKLRHHGLADRFDATVASYEAGGHKPSGAPYDLLRERLPADEYVMVGDSYEADVEAAREHGFVPVHVEHHEEGPDFWETLRAMV